MVVIIFEICHASNIDGIPFIAEKVSFTGSNYTTHRFV